MVMTPRTDDDRTPLADLLERAAHGDVAAFARLYDDTVPRVYGLVLRVVRDPALAEQVTSGVFVAAWREAARYDASRASVMAWLTASAHRCAVEAARAVETVATAASVVPGAPAVADDRPGHAGRVEAALSTLTPDELEAVDLTWGAGYTHREVASLLGTPVDTVLGLLRHGMRRLGRALELA